MKHFLQSFQMFFSLKEVNINRYLLLWTLVIIYSINLPLRYELPLYDEALYARANIGNYGWSQIYMLYYKFLNLLSGKTYLSYYINVYFLNIFLIPVLIYKFLVYLFENEDLALSLAFAFTISRFNLELSPKIHNFNFAFILIVILLKIKNYDKSRFDIFYYLLLTISLYIRSDNIIICMALILLNLFQKTKKQIPLSKCLLEFVPSVFFVAAVYSSWGFFIHSNRNWLAFMDHFYWIHYQNIKTAPENTLYYVKSVVFKDSNDLLSAFLNHPQLIFKHFIINSKQLVLNIYSYLKTAERENWRLGLGEYLIPLIFLWSILISNLNSKLKFENIFNKPQKLILIFYLISSAIKSLITSLILQPQDKYVMEFYLGVSIILIVSLSLIISRRTQVLKLKSSYTAILLPMTLLFYSFPNTAVSYQYKTSKSLDLIRSTLIEEKSKSILYSADFLVWSDLNLKEFQLNTSNYQKDIIQNLGDFLYTNKIDIILYDDNLRNLAQTNGMTELLNFNLNHVKYGYKLKYYIEFEKIYLYVRIK